MKIKNNFEPCGCNAIHEDVIKMSRGKIIGESDIYELSEFFKVFADSTRLKILNALSISEMCVCDITELLHMNQSAVSHQLRVLKQSRLVKYRKEGKSVYYKLDDEHINQIFKQGLNHISEK